MSAKLATERTHQQRLHDLGASTYRWDLSTDSVDWKGPLPQALSPEIPFLTGSIFNAHLDVSNFAIRCKALAAAYAGPKTYSIQYHLSWGYHESLAVEENGKIIYHADGSPKQLEGTISFLPEGLFPGEAQPCTTSGYDTLTGFPGRALINETLETLLEQTSSSKIPGAFLTVSFDRLIGILLQVGPQGMEAYIKTLADRLRKCIRFDDIIGRTSCCTFGIILKDCDRWGVVRASERLLHAISVKNIELGADIFYPSISIGGIAFPHDESTSFDVMRKSEECLFSEQSTKGSGGAWTPYALGIAPDLDRSNKGPLPGKRRARDKTQDNQ